MLYINVEDKELWDSEKEQFVYSKGQTLKLEHSLVSVSKWESNWNKPFLTTKEKTIAETLDYIKCMTMTQNVKDEVYNSLSSENIQAVNDYISNPMTATYIHKPKPIKGIKQEIITAELIYYWMITFNIPFECQKWHLNRLLTLIDVCAVKSSPPKKRSRREILEHYRHVNEKRKEQIGTSG